MARRWTYVGFRGARFVARSPHPKASSLARWAAATFQLIGPSWIMPSPEHDRRSPKSVHREGRAVDIRPASDEEGWRIAHTIADYPDGADVQLILWKDYQWGGRAGPGWRYTGRTDHDSHLHVEVRP